MPLTISRLSASSAVRTAACVVATAWRRVACFGLRLHDVERRERADFDARLVVLDQLGGQRRATARRLRRLDREDADPNTRCARWPPSGRWSRAAGLGDLLIELRDLQLRARAVDAEVAQQRLHVDGG